MPIIDKNKPFSLDPSGSLVTDPIDDILKPAQADPVVSAMVTGGAAAPDTQPVSRLAPATITPKYTGVDSGGKPIKSFDSYYAGKMGERGGYLTEESLDAERTAIGIFGGQYGKLPTTHEDWQLVHNALYGGTQFMSPEEKKAAIEGEVVSEEDRMADAISGPDDDVVDEGVTTEDKFSVPSLESIFEGLRIGKLTVGDYSGDYERISEIKESRISSIRSQFVDKKITQERKNTTATDTLKAKMIKMGVPLSSSSYLSAVDGQEARGSEIMRELEREEARQVASINRDYMASVVDIGAQERKEAMDVNISNINNIMSGYGLAANIWETWNNRDMSEKKLEQDAHQSLMKLQLDMAELDQDERKLQLGMIENFLEQGLYDMQDENVVGLLSGMENLFQLPTGQLTNAGVGGYNNRIANMALKRAQTDVATVTAEEKRALLPLKVAKYKSEIEKNRADLQKKIGDTAASGQTNNLLNAASGYFNEEAVGSDGKIDTQKYNIAKNEFVQTMDPGLKNESYFEGIFYDYFPPTAFLNTQDETAQQIIERYKENSQLGMITLVAAED